MWLRPHSPPFSRRGARGIKSLEAEGGVVSKRSRSLLTCSRSAPYFLLKLLTTPSAPLRNRIFLLRRSHPSLKRRGMGPQPHLNSSPSAQTYKVVADFRPYASFSLDSSGFQGGVAARSIRSREASLNAQTGWLVISNKPG